MDQMQSVLDERDKRLESSAWTLRDDSPLTANQRARWGRYRQELQAIPGRVTDPTQVVFPDPPQ